MFRDLKEYQEIAKIYTEKVSKPEDLEERVRGGGVSSNPVKPFEKPAPQVSGRRDNRPQMKGGIEIKKPTVQGAQGRTKRPAPEKPMPTTAEIRAKDKAAGGTGMSNIPSKEGSAVIDGKKLNPDFGKKVNIKKEFPDKKLKVKKPKMGSPDSKFIKKDKGVGFVKRGTPMAQRAENKEKNKMRAQEMAKKRIAAKKAEMSEQKKIKVSSVPAPDMKYIMSHGMSDQTFADTAKKTFSSNPADKTIGKDGYSTANKFTAELMRRTANTGKDFSGNPLYGNKKDKTNIKSSYEYDAYDLVLEYLLSSEQAATIEEANYVMTEMDAETIQSIVEAQKKTS